MMRHAAILPALAFVAVGCVRPVRINAPKVVTPDGKRPKTVGEWEQALELAQQDRAEAQARERVAADGLKQAKVRSTQRRLFWVVGLALLGAVACFVAAIFLAGIRKYCLYGIIACVAVAGLALGLAAIVPYLIWVGLGVGVVIVAGALLYWQRDHRALQEVAAGTEDYKQYLGTRLASWRDHMRSYIGSGSDKHLDKVRAYVKTLAMQRNPQPRK